MIQEFCNYLRSIRGYSENTIRAYSQDLHTFVTWSKQHSNIKKWSEVTRDTLDAFLEHQQKQGLKASTTNRQLAAISSLFRFAQRQGLTIVNPAQYESRRKQPQTMPKTIPVEHIRKAYERAKEPTKSMLGLLATTGIRIQELLNLRYSDINLTENTIRINGKGSKQRIVHAPAEILAPYKNGCSRPNRDRRIYYVSQRTARYYIYEALRPYSNSPQLSPHVIRHTFATELAKAGESTTTIAKVLGHSHVNTSQKYIDMAQIPTSTRGICLT